MFLFVVRLNKQKYFGSFLEEWNWCEFVREKGKGLEKGLPPVPRKAGGNVERGLGKWELRHDGRVKGLPGRRGWRQDI